MRDSASPRKVESLPALYDLHGRTAMVIGGTGYLGQAFCAALAEAGAQVAIGSRRKERAQAIAGNLPIQDQGKNHFGVECDIANEDSTRKAIDTAASRFGRLDILVTSTVGHRQAGINTVEKADFDYALAVTLTGPFIASQQAAVYMREHGGGSIIHVGSVYGLVGSYPKTFSGLKEPVPPMYHAAKGGVVQLTRYQAVYWAKDNIRVNCLVPGAFPPGKKPGKESNKEDRVMQRKFIKRLEKCVPMKRVGEPWELKGAIVFLASRASNYMTGQNLIIDGGWTAW